MARPPLLKVHLFHFLSFPLTSFDLFIYLPITTFAVHPSKPDLCSILSISILSTTTTYSTFCSPHSFFNNHTAFIITYITSKNLNFLPPLSVPTWKLSSSWACVVEGSIQLIRSVKKRLLSRQINDQQQLLWGKCWWNSTRKVHSHLLQRYYSLSLQGVKSKIAKCGTFTCLPPPNESFDTLELPPTLFHPIMLMTTTATVISPNTIARNYSLNFIIFNRII